MLGVTVDARAGEALSANRLNGRFQSRLRSLQSMIKILGTSPFRAVKASLLLPCRVWLLFLYFLSVSGSEGSLLYSLQEHEVPLEGTSFL